MDKYICRICSRPAAYRCFHPQEAYLICEAHLAQHSETSCFHNLHPLVEDIQEISILNHEAVPSRGHSPRQVPADELFQSVEVKAMKSRSHYEKNLMQSLTPANEVSETLKSKDKESKEAAHSPEQENILQEKEEQEQENLEVNITFYLLFWC